MEKRESTIDIMKGIGILLVIAGHTNLDNISKHVIMSFHMPLFFIIAGYLYKPNCNYWAKLRKDFKRLIVPYLLTSLITMFTYLIISDNYHSIIIHFAKAIFHADTEDHTSLIWAHVSKIGPIWFLFALFWCRISYNLIHCILPSRKYLIIILISITAVIVDRYIINLPFSILPGLSSMIFYLIGDFIHHNGISMRLIFICALCWITHLLFSEIDMCICLYKIYPIDICGAVFGTTVIYFVSRLFMQFLILSNIFSYFGRISLIILCAHTFEWSFNIQNRLADQIWVIIFFTEVIICILLSLLWINLKYIALSFLEKNNFTSSSFPKPHNKIQKREQVGGK